MEIGIVGLGRMGAGMARRLARAGVHVICYDQADAARGSLAAEPNVVCAENLAALCTRLSGERVVILMLPAGGAVEDTLRDLLPLLSAGDTLVDGGNSYYRDSKRSEEHTSELQSPDHLVCRLLLEKKKKKNSQIIYQLNR